MEYQALITEDIQDGDYEIKVLSQEEIKWQVYLQYVQQDYFNKKSAGQSNQHIQKIQLIQEDTIK